MERLEFDPTYSLAFIKPNHKNYSETFLTNQINGLHGPVKVLYGGAFPTRYASGKFLIRNPFHLIQYLMDKKVRKILNISIRNHYLSRYLQDNKISIVLAQYGPCGALVTEACKMAKVPLVIHFHGYDVYDEKTLNTYGELYKNAFKYSSHFISVSREMVGSLVSLGADREKISFISCGVDTRFFAESNPRNSPINYLSVARFAEKKSPLTSIRAFKIVHEKIPSAKLIMAGIGPLWEMAKILAKDLNLENNIQFLGIQTPQQVRELIKNSRAFVQHSVTAASGDKEGTPTSILEASSSGLPIISTFHAGIPDAVIHEKTGFLVKEHDLEQMAQYMILLGENPSLAEEMGKKGRMHMEANYNLPIQIEKLDGVLLKSYRESKGI